MGKKAKKSKKHDRTADAADAGASPPKMKRKDFEQELDHLQVELTRLQAWAVAEGARVIVVFEGRDTAGKGGVIARIMQRCSPRVFKHVALPAPSDRREEPDVYPALHRPFPGRRRDHPVRSVLVQSGRRRAGDGLLQRRAVRAFPEARARDRARDRQQRHHPAEILPRRQPGRAAPALRGPDRGSGQALEAEPDGRRIGAPLVGLHRRPTRRCWRRPTRPRRPGTSCRPTTSGAPGST